MDILKTMIANRQAAGFAPVTQSVPRRGRKPPTKTERAMENAPGSRSMRKFICEEKPSKKVVKDHLEAIVATACESSDED